MCVMMLRQFLPSKLMNIVNDGVGKKCAGDWLGVVSHLHFADDSRSVSLSL